MVGFEPTICDPNQGATRLPSDTIITSILYCKYIFFVDTLQIKCIFLCLIGRNGQLHSLKRGV